MLARTIIIGDMNAASNPAYGRGHATPKDHAVLHTIQMLGLVNLTANLGGQLSHFCNEAEAAPTFIDVYYAHHSTSSGRRPGTVHSC